jgi:hypothetical protein
VVRAYCLDLGLPYVETSLLESHRHAVQHLHLVGRGDQQTASAVVIGLAEARLLASRVRRANQ